jgi:hypothetical protein
MHNCPRRIGEEDVLCYTHVDSRHRHTRATLHVVQGTQPRPITGLAICHSPGTAGVMLYGCDAQWSALTDTWHASLPEAVGQAEHEYTGTSQTWVYYGNSQPEA